MKARKQRRWQPRILRTLSLLGAILPGIIFSAANAKAHSKEETLSAKDRKEVFERIWKDVDEKYYEPKFNGVNWEDVRTRYEPKVALVKDDEEFYNLMKQMVEELHDAHTRFNTPNEWKNREKHQGVSLGFGVEQIEGKTVVNFVRPESEAESKGIKLGMVVQTLDGQPVAELLAASKNKRERNSSERADMLLAYRDIFSGPVDSTLKLGLQRADGSTFETSVTRTIYALPPKVEGKLLPSGNGYIRFDEFETGIARQFKDELEKLRNAPGLVIDLRNNGGGTLDSMLALAEDLLPESTLFAEDRTRSGKPLSEFFGLSKVDLELHAGKAGKQVYAGPVVILVKSRTASASEIYAAGMQDNGRARIIGTQTCGCVLGIVKNRRTKGGGVLEISEILWLTPKGRKLEGEGVLPDREVSPTIADLQRRRDVVLEAAEQNLREMAQEQQARRQQ